MTEILSTEITDSTAFTGIFDILQEAVDIRLTREYEKGRLLGTNYSSVYLGSMESAIQQSVAYVLGRQSASAQADLLIVEALKADNEADLIEAQRLKVQAEVLLVKAETAKAIEAAKILGKELELAEQELLIKQQEVLIKIEQLELSKQQVITEAAKTQTDYPNRIAGTDLITGTMGAERDLITQRLATEVAQVGGYYSSNTHTFHPIDESLIQGILGNSITESKAKADLVREEQRLVTNKSYAEQARYKDVVDTPQGETFDVKGSIGAETALVREKQRLTTNESYATQSKYKDVVDTSDGYQLAVAGLAGAEIEKMASQNLAERTKFVDFYTEGVNNDPVQVTGSAGAQRDLLRQKIATETAQTSGSPSGVMGAQIALYGEQAAAFDKDQISKRYRTDADVWIARFVSDANNAGTVGSWADGTSVAQEEFVG